MRRDLCWLVGFLALVAIGARWSGIVSRQPAPTFEAADFCWKEPDGLVVRLQGDGTRARYQVSWNSPIPGHAEGEVSPEEFAAFCQALLSFNGNVFRNHCKKHRRPVYSYTLRWGVPTNGSDGGVLHEGSYCMNPRNPKYQRFQAFVDNSLVGRVRARALSR